jgi:hypothetical protein
VAQSTAALGVAAATPARAEGGPAGSLPLQATGELSRPPPVLRAQGLGKMSYINGDVYVGQWNRTLREGRGKLRDHSGWMFEGAWNRDQRNGAGVHTDTDGGVLVGRWEQDMIKEGKMSWANGDEYDGWWTATPYHLGVRSIRAGVLSWLRFTYVFGNRSALVVCRSRFIAPHGDGTSPFWRGTRVGTYKFRHNRMRSSTITSSVNTTPRPPAALEVQMGAAVGVVRAQAPP